MHIDVKFRRADSYFLVFGVAMYQYHIPNAVHFFVFVCCCFCCCCYLNKVLLIRHNNRGVISFGVDDFQMSFNYLINERPLLPYLLLYRYHL